jgi:hypothetical protein
MDAFLVGWHFSAAGSQVSHAPYQVLRHDDTTLGANRSTGSRLSEAYQATKMAWEALYGGETYNIPGSGYIPPTVLHPAAELFKPVASFFGMPVVQRTGEQFWLVAALDCLLSMTVAEYGQASDWASWARQVVSSGGVDIQGH